MRVLHTADWHLKSGFGLDDKVVCLDHIIGLAADCDVITIAGDIFSFRGSSVAERLVFVSWWRRLRASGFTGPVMVVKGNHDRKNDLTASIGGLEGVHVYESPKMVTVSMTLDGWEVSCDTQPANAYDFLMLPWPERSGLANHGLSGDHADQVGSCGMLGLIKAMIDSRKDMSRPVIPVGHLNVKGAKVSETQVLPAGDISIGHQDLQETGAAVWLLGHIHKPQFWPSVPHRGSPAFSDMLVSGETVAPVIYPGSLTYKDHGEETDAKGVTIVEVGQDSVSFEQKPLPARRWVTVIENNGMVGGEPIPISGSVVRYQYHCDESERHLFDEQAIKAGLLAAGAHRVTFDPRITRTERLRDGAKEVAGATTNEERLRAWGAVTGTAIVPTIVAKLKQLEGGSE